MKTQNILLGIVLGLILISCKPTATKSLKPSPTGAPGDLLLVLSEKYWDSSSGDTLRSILAGPVEALPQNEPQFRVTYIHHGIFDKTFKTQRNIVYVKIGSDQLDPGIKVQHNLWAKTQILVSVHARDELELIDILNANREELLNLLLNAERKRLIDAYTASADPKLKEALLERGMKLSVPKGYKLDVNEDDFIWLSHEYRDIAQGILIYSYPYTDTATFTRQYLIDKRNEVLKKNVPGEIEGSYMTTEMLFPPLFDEYQIRNKKYTAQLRGLWKMQDGLAMGGPFISVTQLDEERNRVVTLDAFAFAPAHKKRDLLRQLEAIILTIEFTEVAETEEPES